MSFDWDSIKVINNPDLKEIEALFTPNSALSGTASDPTDAVGPPVEQPDGEGGGTDDGGEPGGGVIDCQPPEGYEKCLGHDCYAFTDFATDFPESGDKVKSLVQYTSGSTDGIFPGFAYRDTTNIFTPYTDVLINQILSDEGTTEGPCAPLRLWTAPIYTQTSNNSQFIPDSVVPDLDTYINNGESKTQSGEISFYLYGKDRYGVAKAFGESTFTAITVGIQLWKDTALTDFTENIDITCRIYNNNGKAYIQINGEDTVINEDSIDVTGLYTMNWSATASLADDGTPSVATNLTVTALGTTASANRTGGGFNWKATEKARLGRPQDKNWTRYFSYGPNSTQIPRVIYVGDTSQIAVEDFELACARSIQGYTAPSDCVPWVRPAQCPDCSVPDDCFPECTSYKSQMVPGATMGTEAELEAIYGTGPMDFDGVRFIRKDNYNPAQGDDPGDLPTYDFLNNGEFGELDDSGPLSVDGPCVTGMYGLRPQSGNGIARLTIFSASEMNLFQYQGDYTDPTSIPPRALLNDRIVGGYSALLHCPDDANEVKLLQLQIPIKLQLGLSIIEVGNSWNMAWDRTAKQITLRTDYGNPVVIAYDGGPLIDVRIDATIKAIFEYPDPETGIGERTETHSATITINGTTEGLGDTKVTGDFVYNQYLGHYGNVNNGTILGSEVRVLAISKAGGAGYDAIKEAVKRSFSTYVSTELRCTGAGSKEGCPEEICPDNPCPCSCRGHSLDPLGCNPSVITGGLYDMTDPRTITDGEFLNYDGSQGRVKEWRSGEVSNTQPDVSGKAKALFGSDLLYGFRDNNSGQNRGWATGDVNFEGVPYTGGIAQGFEFSALIGHCGNQALNEPPLIQVPDYNGQTFGRNGTIGYNLGIYLLKGDGTPLISGIGFDLDVERSAPDTVRYREKNNFGGSDTIEVRLPPEVLHPDDNLFWISANISLRFTNEGPAWQVIPGYNLKSALAYRYVALASIYVNGFQIAGGVQVNYKSGYFADDKGMWSTVNTGAIPPVEFLGMKYGNFYSSNGTKVMATVPNINIQKPNLGTNEMFVAFMDDGPGSSLIPASEQGLNLKRIDPNNTPYADCDCS